MHLSLGDLLLHREVPLVDVDPEAASGELGVNLVGELELAVGHRDDADLERGEPHREGPSVVLDENGDEALERAVDRPVEHHGPVLLVVLAHVGEVEALGGVVVELDGAELPLAPDGV